MRLARVVSGCLWWAGFAAFCAEGTAAPERIAFFEKDVLPLLQSTCFKCHGAEAKVKANLYLTSRAGMLRGGVQGPAINETEPAKSLILDMLSFRDDDHSMPPDGKLDAAKIEILKKWIAMGAPWKPGTEAPLPEVKAVAKAEPEQKVKTAEDWWAYKKLVRPAEPAVKNAAWVTNPIDAFILSGLEKENLAPVGPASKGVLIRRAYYDLIGLPPTPAEVDAFVADTAPDAYEKLIDKLLASPQYGEKWGRHWLDLVRFAETNGYERDNPKPFAWRYRDYVIRSFNEDKAYDQFLKEQLAGDELDQVTPESIIATGFYRLNIWDDEPADRKLAKYDVLDGILATTCQAMLGMSMNCARCHNHKRDPILQKDYYSMLAFIQDVSDMQTENITRDILTPEQQAEYDKRLKAKMAREEELLGKIKKLEEEIRLAIANTGGEEPPPAVAPKDDPLPDARKAVNKWLYTTSRPNNEEWSWTNYNTEGWKEGECGFGSRGTPGAVVRTAWRTSDIWLRKLVTLKEVPANLKLSIHHDEDCEIYFNGKLAANFHGFLRDYEVVPLDVAALQLLQAGPNLIAVHCHQTQGGQYIDLGLVVNSEQRSADEILDSKDAKAITQAKQAQYRALKKELDESRKTKLESPGIKAMAVFENGRSGTKIFLRGNPNIEGDDVTPAFPAILGDPAPKIPAAKADAKTTGKRRVLAEWIASKNNQLTARAIANRLWQFHFGRGICRTPNDFGQLGELPTHPELLDWLASEFVSREWKMKSLHKLIMLSSAYRMSSQDNAAALAKDPNNNLFWRFDMRRLSAEEIRDSILAVNGTLNLKMGGPSIYTEVPREVLQSASRPDHAWGVSPPEERTRRSVYILVKRSLNEPILNTFDQADTDTSCPVRFTTTVPTQTLTSLNSKFFNDQAALLAQRLKKEAGTSVSDQVKLGLRLTMGRAPSAKEIERGVKLIQRFVDEDKLTAEKALANFCLMALNLNEFVYLD
ncbi:MAG TPA: PSD1 and planctomycete cytochrome C domain-containing protein [Planctomycetota bacterium]|nr:PSD1 and planctomycete cytochrome C domain-containing protein [Planctomycetota bacterium]